MKRLETRLDDVSSHVVLTIFRVSYHLLRMLDVAAEYRFLKVFLANDFRHGVLIEASYILYDHARLGVGYNFTSFSDNEFSRYNKDEGGFFIRVVGKF